jgi:hypothetical protein
MDAIIYITIGILIGLVFLVMTLVSRGKMYIPEHWHGFLPFSILCAALYFEERVKGFSLAVTSIVIGALISWAGLEVKGAMYQAYVTGWGKAKEPQPEPTPAPPIFGTGFILTKRAQMQASAQVVTAPKINAEQKVAKTLIYQRNQNMKVDLTEEFWIKRGNFDGSREEFVAMKARWVKQGVSYKTGTRKNAPHDIKDWKLCRMIADGHQLPDL